MDTRQESTWLKETGDSARCCQSGTELAWSPRPQAGRTACPAPTTGPGGGRVGVEGRWRLLAFRGGALGSCPGLAPTSGLAQRGIPRGTGTLGPGRPGPALPEPRGPLLGCRTQPGRGERGRPSPTSRRVANAGGGGDLCSHPHEETLEPRRPGSLLHLPPRGMATAPQHMTPRGSPGRRPYSHCGPSTAGAPPQGDGHWAGSCPVAEGLGQRGRGQAWSSRATGSPAHSGTWSHRGASAHAGASREPRVRGHGDGLLGEAAQRAAAGGAGPRPHPAGPDGVAEPRLRGGLPRGLHAPEAHLAGEGQGQSPTALAISLLSVSLQHPGPPRPPSNPPPSSLPPQDQPGKVASTAVHGADSWPKPVSSLL